jgi:hypothetical protein
VNAFLLGLAALVPSVGVGFLFYLAIRALVNADRTERAALARLDADDRAAAQDSPDSSAP